MQANLELNWFTWTFLESQVCEAFFPHPSAIWSETHFPLPDSLIHLSPGTANEISKWLAVSLQVKLICGGFRLRKENAPSDSPQIFLILFVLLFIISDGFYGLLSLQDCLQSLLAGPAPM